ncbi:helix-turn-helix domain-containing protein [Streptomyces sp. W1SF4]|uniref:helix-turn-helix transcriptional regulator n=1 Tax=Streptomyces sp. W1SF4 TaxID=2305220 RepID=UPI000F714A97|nr:helix-turn-helix domain-containing protein [Streptomyces sp. W1SF4]AZM93830.1 MarR family transcriptional regulator [Streptomyces sp. W1SF4]
MEPIGPTGPRTSWTFVTHHARILASILADPEIRLRDMARTCLITERAVQSIVADLESAGYLTRVRNGRRNLYKVTPGTPFRHPAEGGHEVADLLQLLVDLTSKAGTAGRPSPHGDPRERDRSG